MCSKSTLIKRPEAAGFSSTEICNDDMRMQVRIEASRNTMGEADATDGIDSLVFVMSCCHCVLFEIGNRPMKGIMVGDDNLLRLRIVTEERHHTDGFWRNCEKFKGGNFSTG